MPGNADYDISTIKIEPQALGTEGTKLAELAIAIGESIVRINNIAAGLKLGWVAASAEEAQEFGDRWARVMAQMFGEKDGQIGVLPAIAGGISGAAVAFSHLENELWWAFTDFSNELAVPSGGNAGPTDHLGPEFPITQDFPNQ
ncbi:hypothetical protein AB0K81_05390 [Streptomyces werraensis]|uniref:WXG100 family type VII secretion target n=1 Tax=Streptomyces werraensis TaxID=68284 RepID=A0ABV3J950_9ACTN